MGSQQAVNGSTKQEIKGVLKRHRREVLEQAATTCHPKYIMQTAAAGRQISRGRGVHTQHDTTFNLSPGLRLEEIKKKLIYTPC